MKPRALGPAVQSFFLDCLQTMKGLRPASIRSYRDVLKLYLLFTAAGSKKKVSRLTLDDLTFESVLAFLRHLEVERKNGIRTRNQRLAILHTFFEHLAQNAPETLAVAC